MVPFLGPPCIKSLADVAVSDIRSPVSVLRPECEKLQMDGHNSATHHPIYFVFGSRVGFLARIATAHELHELYYDRPTS